MSAAINVVINKPDVAETRRGFKTFGSKFSDTIHKLFSFQNKLIVHHGSTLSYDTNGAGAWQDYAGSFVAISGEQIRSTRANQNLYLTTNNGIYKIDNLTSSPYQAGGIPALDVSVAATGASGFLDNPSQCAYSITWVYTDANGNLIEGDPSQSVTISNNSGNTVNVNVTFTVPSTVTTAYSYRIYRTPQTDSLTVTPGDNFQLASEVQVTSDQVSAKSVTVTDATPDVLLGTNLYTNANDEGELQANDPPPLAKDITTFLGMTMYFNCSTLQQMFVNLIAVGSPNGIQINDTVTLNGSSTYTYTGAANNNFASQQFNVDTSGTIAQNIDNTARNLTAAINQDPSNSEIYAYYISGFNQLPGQIVLKARNLSQSAYSATSSRGAAFNPVLPSSDVSYLSTNTSVPNGVYVSKLNQPEAVPVQNLVFVGSGTVYRGYALRNSVIVEASDGVFRITGTSPDTLQVAPFDNTIVLRGNETGVVLNNSVYSFTTQGVVSIGESSPQIMSRSVEGDLLRLSSSSVYPNFTSLAFGVSYESERQYILAMANGETDTTSTLQYVYNWITNSFVTWNLNVTCGLVNPFDNKLYFGASDGYVIQERKSYTFQDYTDRQYGVNILGVNGVQVTLDSTSTIQPGYTLVQGISADGITRESIISAVNGLTLTVRDALTWDGGAATAYTPIGATVTYMPLHGGYPNFLKRFQPIAGFAFSQANFDQAMVQYTTDLSPTLEGVSMFSPIENVGLSPALLGQWGTFGWGTLDWPTSLGQSMPLQLIPTMLPRNAMLCHWLNMSVGVNQAFRNLALNGAILFFDVAATRYH